MDQNVSKTKKRRLAALEKRGAKRDSSISKKNRSLFEPPLASKSTAPVSLPQPISFEYTRSENEAKIPRHNKVESAVHSSSQAAPSGGASIGTSEPSEIRSDASASLKVDYASRFYDPLSKEIGSGPAAAALELGEQNRGILAVLGGLLTTNPRTTDAKLMASGKIKDRTFLLDNPAVKRHQGRRSRGGQNFSAGLLHRKEYYEKGIYQYQRDKVTYEKLIPLHRKWQAYIAKLLIGTNTLRDVQERLYNAEVVGSLFNVSACKHIQMEGQSGIVLKESSSAFHIFTAYNKHIIVPKKGSTFEFALPSRKKVVTLSGDALIQRAGGGTITY